MQISMEKSIEWGIELGAVATGVAVSAICAAKEGWSIKPAATSAVVSYISGTALCWLVGKGCRKLNQCNRTAEQDIEQPAQEGQPVQEEGRKLPMPWISTIVGFKFCVGFLPGWIAIRNMESPLTLKETSYIDLLTLIACISETALIIFSAAFCKGCRRMPPQEREIEMATIA